MTLGFLGRPSPDKGVLVLAQALGLLDDASATLVLDLVRSSGGRVLAVENHRVDSAAADWARALGQSLVSGQAMNTPAAVAGNEARVSFRCVI